MDVREQLKTIIESLSDDDAYAALRFVQYLKMSGVDVVLRALRDAPFDDELLTREDLQVLNELV